MHTIPVQLGHILELVTGPDEVSILGEYVPEESATETEPAFPDRVEDIEVWNRQGSPVKVSREEMSEIRALLLAEGRRHVERGLE